MLRDGLVSALSAARETADARRDIAAALAACWRGRAADAFLASCEAHDRRVLRKIDKRCKDLLSADGEGKRVI